MANIKQVITRISIVHILFCTSPTILVHFKDERPCEIFIPNYLIHYFHNITETVIKDATLHKLTYSALKHESK